MPVYNLRLHTELYATTDVEISAETAEEAIMIATDVYPAPYGFIDDWEIDGGERPTVMDIEMISDSSEDEEVPLELE